MSGIECISLTAHRTRVFTASSKGYADYPTLPCRHEKAFISKPKTLRKLEYYQGIMLLTTNRVRDFDDAIQSRIHLALRYGPLGVDTRKGIWNIFLQNAITAGGKADCSDENLDDLAKHDLNGRQVCTCFVEVMSSYADKFLLQIRNVVRAAHALASQEGAVTSYSHLEIVINSGKEFETDAQGGSSENMRSYL